MLNCCPYFPVLVWVICFVISLEKHDGIDAVTLILSLCLFRINGCSIFSAYRNRFHGLLDTGKNCFYRMMLRPSMDWRRLLDRCCLSF